MKEMTKKTSKGPVKFKKIVHAKVTAADLHPGDFFSIEGTAGPEIYVAMGATQMKEHAEIASNGTLVPFPGCIFAAEIWKGRLWSVSGKSRVHRLKRPSWGLG